MPPLVLLLSNCLEFYTILLAVFISLLVLLLSYVLQWEDGSGDYKKSDIGLNYYYIYYNYYDYD